MLSRSNLKMLRKCVCTLQNRHNFRKYATNPNDADKQGNVELNLTLGEIGSKYQIFHDSDSKTILDVNERLQQQPEIVEEEIVDQFSGINLQRGVNGVFEIEDLIEVLKRDNAENVFVAAVAPDVKYVDYICIVTGKSYRHMGAIAQFVRRVFKRKRYNSDIVPKIEGKDSKEWIALDLGNIALHIFSRDARLKYDLDTLWAVGPKYDPECNKQDRVVEMLEKHSIYLQGLEPAS